MKRDLSHTRSVAYPKLPRTCNAVNLILNITYFCITRQSHQMLNS